MRATLGSVVTDGGDFITRAAAGGTIATGQTGLILTLTPPSGQRVRLTHMSTAASATPQDGISVLFGSTTVISELDVDGPEPQAPGSRFSVGAYQAYGAGNPPSGNYAQFTGKTDEALTVLKNAGNTADVIFYGYEYGL